MSKPQTKQIKLYSREYQADPFIYVGSGRLYRSTDYKGYARLAWGLKDCEVLVIVGNYGYTFRV